MGEPATPTVTPTGGTTVRVDLGDADLAQRLSGPHMAVLRELSSHTGAAVGLRGTEVHIAGDADETSLAERFVTGAAKLLEQGFDISVADVAHSVRGLRKNPRGTLEELLDQAILVTTRRRPVVPKTPSQRQYVSLIRSHALTFGIGPAGTGKTYLAMAMATAALVQKKVKRIILTRPAVEAGERLGFLPGDLAEKVNPYLRPLYDAMNDMLDYEKIQQFRSKGQIEVAPLAFMRGRTLNDCFVILDEAQNATGDQIKMFLTRLGYGSTAVVTGDVTQTDLPRGARSGLAEARDILSGVQGIAFHHFTDVDVVRHPLVQKIVLAYEARERQELARREAAALEATSSPKEGIGRPEAPEAPKSAPSQPPESDGQKA